ncbi:MAG: hypothetical protein LBJ11_10125 [Oscillospiraceae bacterium]|nr:hypothetical protein [Oscillospiraceae bacterium]
MEESILKIDRSIQGYRMGQGADGRYCLALPPDAEDFAWRCVDFARYETAQGRTVRTDPPDFDLAGVSRDFPETGRILRRGDPAFVVHSTTLAAYDLIRRDGALKSCARLRREGTPCAAIGFAPLGEPEDYLEYIMFAPVENGGAGSEIVINSRLRGEACFDPDAPYRPQARLYFDARKIITDGLAVRDGVHTLKVRDLLPLAGYLLKVIRAENVTLPSGAASWMPAIFTTAANEIFFKSREQMH